AEVSREFCLRDGTPTAETLTAKLKLPAGAILASLDILVSKGLVCGVLLGDSRDAAGFKPAVPPESMTLAQFFKQLGLSEGD
ncbi:hypothetical protein OSL57_26990, partial [Escherichia coli]|nr:hypothetical protein [Escherichia coli]